MAEFAPEFGVGQVLSGQQFDQRRLLFYPFTDEMVPYTGAGVTAQPKLTGSEGASVEQTPFDANQAKVRTMNVNAAVAELLAIYYMWAGYTDVALPDVLFGVGISYNTATGSGTSSYPASQAAGFFVGGGSVTQNPRAHAQASASIIPAIQPDVRQVFSRGIRYIGIAFLVSSTVTLEQILARATQYMVTAGILTATNVTISNASPGVVTWNAHGLSNGQTILLYTTVALPSPLTTTQVYYVVNKGTNTFQLSLTSGGAAINTTTAGIGTQSSLASVQPMPVFKPQYYTLVLIGQQLSLAADASTVASVNASADGSSYGASYDFGNGSSKETGVTTREERIGPVLNAALTLSPSSSTSSTISADVEASTVAISINGAIAINAITNHPAATTGSVTGIVSPSTLAATSPPDIPRSGYYAVDIKSTPDDFRLQFVVVNVVNFGLFA